MIQRYDNVNADFHRLNEALKEKTDEYNQTRWELDQYLFEKS